jgi:hypothetical protein
MPVGLHDLRGGGTKEEEADTVLGVYRPLRPGTTEKKLKLVRQGFAKLDDVIEHGMMGVEVLKHRLDGEARGQRVKLGVYHGPGDAPARARPVRHEPRRGASHMTDVRWMVERDRFPFGVGPALGVVVAPDKATAESRAVEQFGKPIVVRSMLSHESAKRETFTPAAKRTNSGRPRPGARKPRPKSRQQLDAFCADKRRAHKAAKQDTNPTRREA